jgi:hypothetical protein
MKYVGVDFHKKSISICVMVLVGRKRRVLARRRWACEDTEGICRFFKAWQGCSRGSQDAQRSAPKSLGLPSGAGGG